MSTVATISDPVCAEVDAPAPAPLISGIAPLGAGFHKAEKAAELLDHLRAHYRETRRVAVEICADVEIQLPDGSQFGTGTAELRDMSPSGALVANLKLTPNSLPLGAFRLRLSLKDGPYAGIGIEAVPVRFSREGAGLGVKFVDVFVCA